MGGYALLIMSQVSIMIGVQAYNKRFEDDSYDLGIAHFVIYMALWAILEVIHQIKKRRLVSYYPE